MIVQAKVRVVAWVEVLSCGGEDSANQGGMGAGYY
jgi:hypothetical protein